MILFKQLSLASSFRSLLCVLTVAMSVDENAFAQRGATDGQWKHYGGDAGSIKYSNLDEINPKNFNDLQIAWQWSSPENPRIEKNRRLGTWAFEATPLKIDGVLYISTSHSDVVAINAASGETIWSYDPGTWKMGRPTNLGFLHRGVAFWEDGDERRIFIGTGDGRLIALDAKNGEPVANFGNHGEIDLKKTLRRPTTRRLFGVTSPPVVCRDIVIVGSSIFDGPTRKQMPPGDVQAFDARTGKLVWTFHSIPLEGELGNDTWEDGSWKYTGNANVWTLMSVDEELGYVYLPFGTPTNDWYGGHRPGMGLFGESLVCLKAETGERVWHFQHVHHGVWDYDLCAAPALVDIEIGDKQVKALAQVTKQGFCWVLDRTTGEGVWPIEERPVPQSNVPGEKTWPTQPFPTKPAPFERQGSYEDGLIDFTPSLRAEAKEILEKHHHGPLYTPPSVDKPTLNVPGWGGGGNWNGCAFDPETSMLYIPSMQNTISVLMVKPDPARSNFNYIGRLEQTVPGPKGLPLWKPPYSSLTAIDLRTGNTAWTIPTGDGPRDHALLKDLDLPKLGDFGRPFVLATKTLIFVAHTSSAKLLLAYDKSSGNELGRIPLSSTPNGAPMTYLENGRQYLVVPVGGRREPGGLVALKLP